MDYIYHILSFIFGAVIGSFLNVCIYRLPRDRSIVSPPSACPDCGELVRAFDNIPIISYLVLRGKCRHCGSPISKRYPAIEFLTAVLFLIWFHKFGLSVEFGVNILFVCLLVVVAFIDLEFQIIPDILSLGGMVLGIVLAVVRSYFMHIGPKMGLLDAIYGVLLGGGVLLVIAYGYQIIAKREGMGGGDIKLLAMIGAFTGFKGVIFALVGGSLIGTLVGIPLMLIKKENSKYAIPFGPFLSLGALFYTYYSIAILRVFENYFLVGR